MADSARELAMAATNDSGTNQPFQPRGRDLVIGGIPWIARMSDKARAKADGTIDDYIYPCPIDRRVLGELGISADEFIDMSVSSDTDAELVRQVRERRRSPEPAAGA